MRAHYERGGVKLWNCDCLTLLDVLPREAAIVSDPPYGIDYQSGPISRNSISSTRKRFSITIAGDDIPFDPQPWLAFPLVAFTGAQYFYDRLPPGGSLHCWDKRGEYKRLDQADADFVWLSKPAASRVLHLVWRGICRHAENNCKIEHPTQKPVALMEWIFSLLEPESGMPIIDPYMGSGSTLVACVQTGRRGYGVELDPRYFDIACRRIDAAFDSLALIDPTPPALRQASMFAPDKE